MKNVKNIVLASVMVVAGGALLGAAWWLKYRSESIPPLMPRTSAANAQASTLLAILKQAEDLGMPSCGHGTLYVGARPDALPGSEPAPDRGLHLQRADGSWLLDLVDEATNTAVSVDQLAKWTSMSSTAISNSMMVIPLPEGSRPHRALIVARRLACGLPMRDGYLRAPRIAPPDTKSDLAYPRQSIAVDLVSDLRIACAEWFLLRHQPASEQDLLSAKLMASDSDPVAARWLRLHREAVPIIADQHDNDLERLVGNMITRWQRVGSDQGQFLDMNAIPISEASLARLADDLRPCDKAHPGITIGDLALSELTRRWSLDPALLLGRAPNAPWTDDEQRAVAAGLMPFVLLDNMNERMAWVAGHASAAALKQVITTREGKWGQDQAEGERIAIGRSWLTRYPDGPPAGLTPPDVEWFLTRFGHDPTLPSLLGKWPTSGPFAPVVAACIARNSSNSDVDALGLQWLKSTPSGDDLGPIALWLIDLNPSRWEHIRSAFSGDLNTAVNQTLIRAAGFRWPSIKEKNNYGAFSPGAIPLTLLGLCDERPIPKDLLHDIEIRFRIPTKGPPMRICDVVATNCSYQIYYALLQQNNRQLLNEDLPEVTPIDDPIAREQRLHRMRNELAISTESIFKKLGMTFPPEWQAIRKQAVADQLDAAGLTHDEAEAVKVLVASAVSHGLPDPSGWHIYKDDQSVHGPGFDDWPIIPEPHIRLKDQSWLLQGVRPVHDQDFNFGPPDAFAIPKYNQAGTWKELGLDAAAAKRVASGRGLGNPVTKGSASWPGLRTWVGLAWWLGGQDTSGDLIVASALELTIESPEPAVSRVERGVRRALVEWFLSRVAWDRTPSHRIQMAQAALAMAPETEHPAVAERIAAYEQLWKISLSVPEGADLEHVLMIRDPSRYDLDCATDADFLSAFASPNISRNLRGCEVQYVADLAYQAWLVRRPLDIRWAVCQQPEIITHFGPVTNERPPWTGTKWNHDGRLLMAKALQRWFVQHPSAEMQASAMLESVPDTCLLKQAFQTPVGILPTALAKRFSQKTMTSEWESLMAFALAEDPRHPDLLAFLKTQSGPKIERLHNLQAALERNDPTMAMALIDEDLKQGSYDITGQNLGLLAHSGSFAALQRLREWAAGPPNQAPFIHLWIGHAFWPIAGLGQAGERIWRRQEIAAAIPLYLAWESLTDLRPCRMSSEMGQARVCDVVAFQLMDNLAGLQIPPLPHIGSPGAQQIKQELCQNPSSRDKIVTMLRDHLAPVAREFYALAKWPEQPATKGTK